MPPRWLGPERAAAARTAIPALGPAPLRQPRTAGRKCLPQAAQHLAASNLVHNDFNGQLHLLRPAPSFGCLNHENFAAACRPLRDEVFARRMVRRSFGRPRHHQARKNYAPGKINPTAGSPRRAVYKSRFGCPHTVRAVPFPGRRRVEVHLRWKATARQHQDGALGGGPATMARRAVSQSSHCPALGTGSARSRAAGPLNPGTEGRHGLEIRMATAEFKFKPSRDLSACCRPPPTPTRAT